MRYQWKELNKLQVGAYAEYFVKMEFTMYGFQVYSTEVDDRGVDFICRYEGGIFYEIQVKSLRGRGYVFVQKDKFRLRRELLMAFVLLNEGKEPELLLIPSLAWQSPNALLVSRDYEGKKSKPEWGVNVSRRNYELLSQFAFSRQIENMKVPNQKSCRG